MSRSATAGRIRLALIAGETVASSVATTVPTSKSASVPNGTENVICPNASLTARVRAAVCRRLGFLGVEIDERANARADGDRTISTPSSASRVHVITAREDIVVARAVRLLTS